LDFVDDGLTGCFDAKVGTHIGYVIRCCLGADYALCIHDFPETIAFDEELVMAWLFVEFTNHRARNTGHTLRLDSHVYKDDTLTMTLGSSRMYRWRVDHTSPLSATSSAI